MIKLRAVIFPVSAVVLFVVAIAIVYLTAVFKHDVNPIWPYISDCAALYPESSIFAQLIDIVAAFVVCMLLLRYKRVQVSVIRGASHVHSAPFLEVLNKVCLAAFLLAIISTFGLVMLADYQESRLDGAHFAGTMIMFIGGILYMTLDAVVSWIIQRNTSYAAVLCRLAAVCLAWTFAISGLIGRQLSLNAWNKHYPDQSPEEKFFAQVHWNSTEPGYSLHIMSTVSEWMTVLMFLFYFCTFVNEFSKFSAKFDIDFESGVAADVPSSGAPGDAMHQVAEEFTSSSSESHPEVPNERTPLI